MRDLVPLQGTAHLFSQCIMEISMGGTRRRSKHEKTFKERLAEEAAKFREAADRLPPGTERDLLLRRVNQAERAAQISDWLASPKATPPAVLTNLLKTN